ncbi:hypothetical protein [Limimaricola cinnabarinus]|jgi:predicted negative regulator of RcsB-dependent stress response|uniref:hypothetical protein n=1 Tax=Limimaricola cinnabarinus TaxID=1125964 RepID=UPI0013A5FBCA|nr:hypothetical protein [Limimaricola cinnabarinus]
MKLLVAAACLVIIAGGGWYGWSEWQAAQRASEQAAKEAEYERRQRSFDNELRRNECSRQIADWDKGNRRSLIQKYGDYAENIVNNCRYLVAIPSSDSPS